MRESIVDQYKGSCRCGAVLVTASGPPDRVGLCHCMDCRKYHGTLFHASAVFPEDAVAIFGETRAYEERHFCPHCGSPVFGRSGNEIEVSLGIFDEPDQLVPTYELWTVRREKWLPEFSVEHRYERDRDDSAEE